MAAQHLIKITNKAKQLRRANPKLKWTDAVKKASKLIKPAAKKAAPKKRVAKKVSGVKKSAPKKTETKTHKDTKSHNVNIRVVSGVGGVSEKIKQLAEYQKLLQREQKAIQSIAYWKGQIKNPSTAANGMHAKAFFELNKKQLVAIKQQISIQKKLI